MSSRYPKHQYRLVLSKISLLSVSFRAEGIWLLKIETLRISRTTSISYGKSRALLGLSNRNDWANKTTWDFHILFRILQLERVNRSFVDR
jgi:hypothetical protein